MTKQKILAVVEQMLKDWQTAYDSKDVEVVSDLVCHEGFCAYIILKLKIFTDADYVFLELKKRFQK